MLVPPSSSSAAALLLRQRSLSSLLRCATVDTCRPLSNISSSSPNSNSHSNNNQKHFDVLIVGGGAVGSALAAALQSTQRLSRIGLLEFRGAPPPLSTYHDGKNQKGAPNARAYALSPSSLELINYGYMCRDGQTHENIEDVSKDVSGTIPHHKKGPIEQLDAINRVAWYDHMQIWESDGPATLHFSHADLSTDSIDPHKDSIIQNGYRDVLGAVVEDGPLVSALWEHMKNSNTDNDDSCIEFMTDAAIKSINAPPTASHANFAPPPPVELTYQQQNATPDADSTGHPLTDTVTADLLVAADGANSTVRRMLGLPTVGFGYGRRAVTCTVKVDSTMRRTAYQRFMPNGPMALLPIWSEGGDSDSNGEIYANIVWSTTPSHAAQLQKLSEAEFLKELNDCMQSGPLNTQPIFPTTLVDDILPGPIASIAKGVDALARGANDGLTMSRWTEATPFGLPPTVSEVVGPRLAFDLTLSQAQSYVAPRVALVGDAAHTVHPMAGQGLNLGMGDAECLVRHIVSAIDVGMDPSMQHFLKQYDEERRREVGTTQAGINALHGMFGTTFGPAVYVRSLWMNLVNSASPVRRRLAEMAAGRRSAFPGM